MRRRTGAASLVAALVGVLLLLADLWVASGHAPSDPYMPLFATRHPPGGPEPRGTIKGDFTWAATSPTWQEAESRWKEFLRRHRPPSGEFEDAFHHYHVTAAMYELMRVYYSLGRSAEGDALLRALDPLGVKP